ncbi:MAG: hypothetical protein IPH45_17355 [Bacteroidales bacterium]|nr:hypothetical protein [Bacteroidales bacterium]
MKSYLTLQYRMLNRHLQEAGLQPWVGYPLFLLAFIGLSEYLFQKTSFAAYFFLLFALSIISDPFSPAIFIRNFSFTTHNSRWNFTIPTPFSKHPFEFAVGFRKTFLAWLFAYFLTIMAISVGNFNLGVFSWLYCS